MLRIVNKVVDWKESAHPSWGTLKGETVPKDKQVYKYILLKA